MDEGMRIWKQADAAGEDAYVEAVQTGTTADEAHKAGDQAAARIITDAMAADKAEIVSLQAQVEVLEKTSDDLHKALWERDAQLAQERAKAVEAERGALERAAGALEADAPLCDCNAHGSHECCCGAWDDRKTVTLERAAEIVRSLIGEGK